MRRGSGGDANPIAGMRGSRTGKRGSFGWCTRVSSTSKMSRAAAGKHGMPNRSRQNLQPDRCGRMAATCLEVLQRLSRKASSVKELISEDPPQGYLPLRLMTRPPVPLLLPLLGADEIQPALHKLESGGPLGIIRRYSRALATLHRCECRPASNGAGGTHRREIVRSWAPLNIC